MYQYWYFVMNKVIIILLFVEKPRTSIRKFIYCKAVEPLAHGKPGFISANNRLRFKLTNHGDSFVNTHQSEVFILMFQI